MEKNFIQFEENPSIPKYRQIIDAIQQKIKAGELKKGDKIPSLNMLCKQYGLQAQSIAGFRPPDCLQGITLRLF